MTPYQMGQKARRQGKGVKDCPYSKWTQAEYFSEWCRGWEDTNSGITALEKTSDEKFETLFTA